MKNTRIFDEETGLETGVELVAQHIEKLAMSMAKIEKGKASRRLIVALLHDDTKLGKSQIELILDSLEGLGKRYLKPEKIAGKT